MPTGHRAAAATRARQAKGAGMRAFRRGIRVLRWTLRVACVTGITSAVFAQGPAPAGTAPMPPAAASTAASSAPSPLAEAMSASSAPTPPSSTALPASAGSPPAAAGRSAIDPAQLAAFVDGVVRAYMVSKGIAGVTVAVTSRDGPLLLRGYGIAGDHPRRAVDPGSTLFRIGSISKTFTYVAAMQLVAAHKLDLDAPVDDYLPRALKTDSPRYPPIRIWHLMTHSAGFEDAALSAHLFFRDPRTVPQLDAYLARYRPKRVRAPAVHADYSNYSVALLGAIEQQVSGEPFERYIERHVLDPLDLRHTTFREPLPEGDPRAVPHGLAKDFSTAFQYENGGFAPRDFEYSSADAPDGAASSDAADMATWMRMLLNGGGVAGHEVLDPITFHEMVTPTFRNAPAVHAIAHGFFIGRYGRYASLEHAGDTLWFHSNMVVLPQAGLGVFVSTNTDTGESLAMALPRLFFEHFLPDARPQPPPAPPGDFARSGQIYAGIWLSQRRNYSTIEKALTLDVARTAVTPDGHLVLSANGESKRYVEQSRDIFRNLDTSDRIQFLRDAHGRLTGLAAAYGHAVFDRASFLDNPDTALATLALLLVVCLCALVGASGRRGRPPHGTPTRRREARAPAATALAAVCGWLLFLIAASVAAQVMSAAGYRLLFDFPPPVLVVVVALGYLAAVLTLVALGFLPRAWRLPRWSFWRKLRHTLILALMLWTLALLIEWKILLAPLML